MAHSDETQATRHFDETEETSERWQQVKRLFEAASALKGAERARFLENAAGDEELKKNVEKLLESFESAESFLENPAVAEAESLFADKATLVGAQTTGSLDDGSFVAGTVLASRYRIIGLLGKGGMGEVYKAEDIKLAQRVALKFLPDRLERDPAALARFHAEVRTARHVSHPNVCRVFDIGEADGRHFLSMELIDGDDLSSLLRRIGRLPSERAVEIARELCVGLAAIHNAGILHRDFKPANVIVDAKGKVRITDFGIAGFETDVAGDRLRVGTPAYMSPEQIRGRDVSVKSDIYALGLVLYEIFTGKQAFQAESIHELIRKHQTETPTNPSEYVKGIDPLVESVIGRCLEKNPDDRPPSALHVAMALPGGNPMQIALEAGETPSPEMVAASPKKGALKPLVALPCAAGALALLVFCLFFSMKLAPQNRIPFNKSAEVLSERAGEIAQKLGYPEAPVEKWSRFYNDDAYERYALQNPAPENWEKISTGQPLMFAFIERQSPRYLDIMMVGNGYWTFEPQTTGGMRTILLDTRGRLVEFSAVPPPFVENPAPAATTDFAAAFAAAELDPSKFKETSPQWTPAVAYDTRRAWEGAMTDHPEIPLRVEAAGFQGAIVSFRLIYPWTKPDATDYEKLSTRDWISTIVFAVILIGLVVTAIFLVRRNLRSGSGDRPGAFKISLVVFAAITGGWLFSMTHVAAFLPELNRLVHSIRIGLYAAAITWILYLALEPLVRRNLPELMVSWNRLLIGDWRDPLVGRDVLLGTAAGVAHYFLALGGRLAEQLFYGDYKTFFIPDALIGLRSFTSMLLVTSSTGIFGGFAYLCVLGLLFLLFRRRDYASIALFFLITAVSILFFTTSFVNLPFTLTISALAALVIARAGLVATVFAGLVFGLLQSTLFTLNFSAWYTSGMFITLALVLALLIYGLKTSLAGQTFGDR